MDTEERNRYFKELTLSLRREDAADGHRSAALDQVISIAKTTAEYMSQMEAAPQLTASGLTGDYRLLADFNSVVLAGHPTQYGVQFITWERVQERTGLNQGDYHGPLGGVDCYATAKQDFVTRSGLVSRSALFTPDQLAEMYRCICDTLASNYPITDERQKCLESTAEQIETAVPDLVEWVAISTDRELKFADKMFAKNNGIQFS